MDPSLSYSTVLGVAPKESSRQLVAYQPSNGGPYVSDSNSIISIDIPATAYLNPDASYVKFRYTPSVVRNGGTAPAVIDVNTKVSIVLDGGATSCFSRATLINGNGGAVVSETTDFAEVAQHLIRNKGEDFAKSVGLNAMGWHPCFVQDDGIDSTSKTGSIQNVAAAGELPGVAYYNAGAVGTSAPAIVNDAVFAIPLSFFSGLFNQDMALPLKHMGTANALRLDLTVNSAAKAMYICSNSTSFLNSEWTESAVTYKFTLSEVELMSSLSNVGEAIDMNVKNMIESSGIHIKYTDVTARSDSNWSAGLTEYQMTTNKPALSLDKITVQLRDSTKMNSVAFPSVTGYRRHTLRSLQAQIGSVFYPSTPLRLTSTNYNGPAYLETAQTTEGNSGLNSRNHVYAPSYNGTGVSNAGISGFELGFNLGARQDSYQFNGRDTRTGSSAVSLRLEKTDTITPLSILVIFEATWPLLVDKSGVIPAARG